MRTVWRTQGVTSQMRSRLSEKATQKLKHLLEGLLEIILADGSIDEKELERLMPWSKELPAECYSKRRK